MLPPSTAWRGPVPGCAGGCVLGYLTWKHVVRSHCDRASLLACDVQEMTYLARQVKSFFCVAAAITFFVVDYIILIIVAPIDHNIAVFVAVIVNFEVSTGGKGLQWAGQLIRQRDNRITPPSSEMEAVSWYLPFYREVRPHKPAPKTLHCHLAGLCPVMNAVNLQLS